LAAATFLSAEAISGLRSSIAEGSPVGTDGTVAGKLKVGSEKSDAGLPMSKAIACSNCERCTPISIS